VTDDAVAAKRAELDRLTGAARTRALLELGRLLSDRYWRAGPGRPAAAPYLDAAVKALDEAYGYLDPGDNLRGQVAAQLGWLLGARHLAHGSADRDQKTAMHLLEEALAFPQLPPILRSVARIVLGQLYLSVVTKTLQSADLAMTALRSGTAPPEAAYADRAVDCFRQVLAEPLAGAEVTRTAETLLAVAEAIQTMMSGFGGAPGGLDLGKMMQAMATLQKMQEQQGSGTGGLPPMPSFVDAEQMAAEDPLDRPVTVVYGPEPTRPDIPRPRRPAAPAVDAAALRRELRDRIAPDGDLWASAAALLEAPPSRSDVDDLVALATSVVHTANTDHLLLAVALWLRSRTGAGDGWGAGGGDGDLQAATRSLAEAAPAVLAEEPDAVGLLLRLAVRLAALDRLTGAFAEVAAALRTVGAEALGYPQPDGTAVVLDAASGTLAVAARPWPRRIRIVGAAPEASSVASHGQLLELSRRRRLPFTADPVFVATRDQPSFDVLVLRRTFYPRSVGLGQTIENVDGPGTADDVRAHLTASVLHLDCPVDAAGALQLAGPSTLAPADLPTAGAAAGGVVILPNGDYEFPRLADAFLAAGCVAVIGWRRRVPEPVATLMLLLLHAELADRSRNPADAVLAVRDWLTDPDRAVPSYLPIGKVATELADPGYAAALVHRGV